MKWDNSFLLSIPQVARPHLVHDTTGVTAIDDQGRVAAIAVMDTWSVNACYIHVTIFNPMVLRHGFQEEVFSFVFQSGRKVIIGRTPSDNEKALKFNRHMGFEEIARIPDAYEEGIDCVITQLRKENCKWLR